MLQNDVWPVPRDRLDSASEYESISSFHIDLDEVYFRVRGNDRIQPLGFHLELLACLGGTNEFASVQSTLRRRAWHNVESGLTCGVAQCELENTDAGELLFQALSKVGQRFEGEVAAPRRIFQEFAQELPLMTLDVYAVRVRGQDAAHQLARLPVVDLVLDQIEGHPDSRENALRPSGRRARPWCP